MLEGFIDAFVRGSKQILADALTGIYLHGSAAMDCFNPQTSDIDLLVVIRHDISKAIKRQYMDMVVRLNEQAPAKGLELSLIREEVCAPFVYPTPFELHFSIAHLDRWRADPEDYVEKMHGTDKDLAAHVFMLCHRGRTLYGKDAKSLFAPVCKEQFLDSLWYDIQDAAETILMDPVYTTLNLCRALAYKTDELIFSKREGGAWGLEHLPKTYHPLIEAAMNAYGSDGCMALDVPLVRAFADHMLAQMK